MQVLLFVVALSLTILLSIPALIHTIFGAIRRKGKSEYVLQSFFAGAHALDVFGNVAYATFLNDWFIRKGGYHYGRRGETISSATGKNWVAGKLTWMGLGLCGLLNWIDTDHCWKYIERDASWVGIIKPPPVKWPYIVLFVLSSICVLVCLVMLWQWVFSIF